MKDDVVEIDLLEILRIAKKNIIQIIALCLLFAAVGFSTAKFVLPKKYKATTKIIIVKDESQSNSAMTYSDLQTSQKLATTYSQIIMSEAISDKVISELNLSEEYGIDTNGYNNIVSVSNANNTEVMSIQVETTEPELSANIANKIVDVFISEIYDIYDVQNVTILNRAKVPENKSYPSTFKFTAIGGVAGLFVSASIIVIKSLIDSKVKTEEEVKAIFDYPIIGSIPDFDVNEEQVNG